MNHQKKQGGFSLVELIVAIAIMAIIVLPLLRAFMVSATANAKAKKKLQATESAQNVMETIEVTSLDELLAYFSPNPDETFDFAFGENKGARLAKESKGYAILKSREKSTDGNYYFGLQGVEVNGYKMDVLMEITANNEANGNGVVLNDQNVTKVTAISSDNDALCTVTETAADIMPDIWARYPDDIIGQSSVTRNITITIGQVTDPDPEIGTYTKVTTNHYYTWAGGSYPATSTDTDFSDVVFDNSDDKSDDRRQLNNIYLFYYPWYTSTIGNLTDYITINNTTGQAVNVFIIKQKMSGADDSYQLKETNYRVKVNVVENVPVSATKASTKLRTNFKENIYGGTSTTDPVIALNGSTLNADKISSDALTVEEAGGRLFNVTVTTYPSGSYPNFTKENGDEINPISESVTGGMVN